MKKFSTTQLLLIFIRFFCTLASDTDCKCDDEVIKCIKDVNGGKFPVNAWTPLQTLWNKDYSIVWYSADLVKEQNLTCITTVFSLSGSKDTYYRSCSDTEEISFNTVFDFKKSIFTISDYQGLDMMAYAIYKKYHCLGLYVCSPEGVTAPHITIYCPTADLEENEVKTEIQEAKAMFTSCNINDGMDLCQQDYA